MFIPFSINMFKLQNCPFVQPAVYVCWNVTGGGVGELICPLVHSRERIHIPPGEVRKIINSKVPAGRGYLSFKEGKLK